MRWPNRDLPEGSGIGSKRAVGFFLIGLVAAAIGVGVVFYVL